MEGRGGGLLGGFKNTCLKLLSGAYSGICPGGGLNVFLFPGA